MGGRRDKLDESIIGTLPELAPDPIVETSTPKSTSFVAGYDRDINEYIEVTIENNTSSAATEDITVALHDGSSTSDPTVSYPTISNPQTKSSGSVASGGSTTVSFLTERVPLDAGDYTVDVSQSGSTLSITQTKVDTTAAVFVTRESGTGEFQIVDQDDSLVADTGPIGGSLGSGSGGESVDGTAIYPTSVNNEVYARHFNGSDLSAKIVNALDWLDANVGGQGQIRVTPKDDGTAWQWTQDLVESVQDRSGIDIIVDPHCRIDYTGSGTMLTIRNTWDYTGEERTLTLSGGVWHATNSDPQCWLRVEDSYSSRIHPTHVRQFSNSTNDCRNVQIVNRNSYSESTHISGKYRGDVNLEFIPASKNPDSTATGTESFHDTKIDHFRANGNVYCIITGGKFQYCTAINATLQPHDQGAVCILWDSPRTEGTVFTGTKFESPQNPGDISMMENGPNFDNYYNPLFLGTRMYNYGVDNETVSGESIAIPSVFSRRGEFNVRSFGADSGITFGEDKIEASAAVDAASGNEYTIDRLAERAFSLAGSGNADLGTSGDAVVDTGVPYDTASHFQPVVSPPDGVDVATSLEYDSATSANYLLHIEQNTTSTGSVSVGWQLLESNL